MPGGEVSCTDDRAGGASIGMGGTSASEGAEVLKTADG